VGLAGLHLHECHDTGEVLVMDLNHPLQQDVPGINQVITEQDSERLLPHMHLGAEHCVPKTSGVKLAHIVHVGEVRGVQNLLKATLVTFLFELSFDFCCPVEVVLQSILVAPRNHQHIVETGIDRFFHHILNRWLVDNRKHLFRHRLGGRQKASAKAGRGDYCFADGHPHIVLPSLTLG
jgi:hypothetical protein